MCLGVGGLNYGSCWGMERSKAREIVARGAPSPDKSGLKCFIIEICPVKCSNPKGTGCFKTYFYLFMYPFT